MLRSQLLTIIFSIIVYENCDYNLIYCVINPISSVIVTATFNHKTVTIYSFLRMWHKTCLEKLSFHDTIIIMLCLKKCHFMQRLLLCCVTVTYQIVWLWQSKVQICIYNLRMWPKKCVSLIICLLLQRL